MFEFSLTELLLIAVAALLVIGPQDMPKVLRAGLRVLHQVQGALAEIRKGVHELADESGLRDVRADIKTIIDQEGNPQPAYDIREFLQQDETPKPRILTEKDLFDER